MKKTLIFIVLFFHFVVALDNKIDVSAKTFKSEGNVTVITGSVHIVKGQDILDSDLVKIYTDKERKPINYEAIGNVRFSLVTNDGRKLRGKSERLVYEVAKNEYRLYDNAHIEEIGKANVIKGDLVILTNNGDYANVVGNNKKPARVTFLLDGGYDEKKDSKDSKGVDSKKAQKISKDTQSLKNEESKKPSNLESKSK